MTNDMVFQVLRASLFSSKEGVHFFDWKPVFEEMKVQAVAALPELWLKTNLPSAKPWLNYCAQKQGQWVRVMHGQDQLLQLFNSHNIPCVIIKGAAAAMAYPHPSLRSMGDVDVLVKRKDHDRAAELMEVNGYTLTHDKEHVDHHYNYSKDKISFELHRKMAFIDEADEKLLTLFEEGIDDREWHQIGSYRFPTLPPILNGLTLMLHINQHLRGGLGLRQIIDWMMYVHTLPADQWEELLLMLSSTDIDRLALTTTAMCQRYLGLRHIVDEDGLPVEEFMNHIMEKGNFGQKAGVDGKAAAFSLSATEQGGFFRRLQIGGLGQWKAAKKYPILRPFAWIYQSFRIIGILFKNKMGLKEIMMQRQKGMEQRKLIENLGLKVDRTVQFSNPDS